MIFDTLRRGYVVVAFNMDGLYPDKNQLIEIAAKKVVKGEVTDDFYTKIQYSKALPEIVQNVTGLTTSDFANETTSEKRALSELQDFIGDYPTVSWYGHQFSDLFVQQIIPDYKTDYELSTLVALVPYTMNSLHKYDLASVAKFYGLEQTNVRLLNKTSLLYYLTEAVLLDLAGVVKKESISETFLYSRATNYYNRKGIPSGEKVRIDTYVIDDTDYYVVSSLLLKKPEVIVTTEVKTIGGGK